MNVLSGTRTIKIATTNSSGTAGHGDAPIHRVIASFSVTPTTIAARPITFCEELQLHLGRLPHHHRGCCAAGARRLHGPAVFLGPGDVRELGLHGEAGGQDRVDFTKAPQGAAGDRGRQEVGGRPPRRREGPGAAQTDLKRRKRERVIRG